MPDLSSNSRRILLDLARSAIKTHLETGDYPSFKPAFADLEARRGCFVTLRKGGKLRGCVGTFQSGEALYENVMRMAVSAAFQDHRFEPLSKNEIHDIRIEISVLGELQKVSGIDEIQTGRHGVYVRLGQRSGTYLPDVASEQKWDALEFVTRCAREKAGLKPAEIAAAELYRYEVEKFGE